MPLSCGRWLRGPFVYSMHEQLAFIVGVVAFSPSSKTVNQWVVGVAEWRGVGCQTCIALRRSVQYVQGNTKGFHTKGSAGISCKNV